MNAGRLKCLLNKEKWEIIAFLQIQEYDILSMGYDIKMTSL